MATCVPHVREATRENVVRVVGGGPKSNQTKPNQSAITLLPGIEKNHDVKKNTVYVHIYYAADVEIGTRLARHRVDERASDCVDKFRASNCGTRPTEQRDPPSDERDPQARRPTHAPIRKPAGRERRVRRRRRGGARRVSPHVEVAAEAAPARALAAPPPAGGRRGALTSWRATTTASRGPRRGRRRWWRTSTGCTSRAGAASAAQACR